MRDQLLPPGVKPIFRLGTVVFTSQAMARIPVEDVSVALGRHAQGDWGDVMGVDVRGNEVGLKCEGDIHSAYRDRNGTEFWIITDDGWKTTTVLLPDDY